MRKVPREMSHVFAMPDERAVYWELDVARQHDYVDPLGEPIDPARFDNGIVMWSPEEMLGVKAARVTQFRIARALQIHQWALVDTLQVFYAYGLPSLTLPAPKVIGGITDEKYYSARLGIGAGKQGR